jgi:hypothetical protein
MKTQSQYARPSSECSLPLNASAVVGQYKTTSQVRLARFRGQDAFPRVFDLTQCEPRSQHGWLHPTPLAPLSSAIRPDWRLAPRETVALQPLVGRCGMRREELRRERPRSGWAAGTSPAEIRIGISVVVSWTALSGSGVSKK